MCMQCTWVLDAVPRTTTYNEHALIHLPVSVQLTMHTASTLVHLASAPCTRDYITRISIHRSGSNHSLGFERLVTSNDMVVSSAGTKVPATSSSFLPSNLKPHLTTYATLYILLSRANSLSPPSPTYPISTLAGWSDRP
jgi:hypothetical protein